MSSRSIRGRPGFLPAIALVALLIATQRQEPLPTGSRCYRLVVGQWAPVSIRHPFDSVVVRLDTVTVGQMARDRVAARRLLPAPERLGIRKADPARWWRVRDTLHLDWGNGFLSFSARLTGPRDTLRGRINYGSDAVYSGYPEGPVAPVTAIARPCPR